MDESGSETNLNNQEVSPLSAEEAEELKNLNRKQTDGVDEAGNPWTDEDFKRQTELETRRTSI